MYPFKTPRAGDVIRIVDDGLNNHDYYVLGEACGLESPASPWSCAGFPVGPKRRRTGFHVQDLATGELSTLPGGRYYVLSRQTERKRQNGIALAYAAELLW